MPRNEDAVCPSSEHLALMAAQINGVLASSDGLILGGQLAVLQAPIFDSLSFDPFALFTSA